MRLGLPRLTYHGAWLMYWGMCGLMSLESINMINDDVHKTCVGYTGYRSRYTCLPSSSTSAGAVPAFLASSSSFFLRQSSLDSFCADTADEDMITDYCSL